jgi:excisionase family DNA binding protein
MDIGKPNKEEQSTSLAEVIRMLRSILKNDPTQLESHHELTMDDVRQLQGILKKDRLQSEKAAHFTPAQLAARWGVTTITLRRWRQEDRIRALRLGRAVRFTREEVERVEREAKV